MSATHEPLLAEAGYVHLTVECDPTLARTNRRYADRRSKRLSSAYLAYRTYVLLAWEAAGKPTFHEGPVGVEISAYWTRTRKLDYHTPYADVDAIAKATLDALHAAPCLCIDTDMRVEPLVLRKFTDKENPRVEIVIWKSA